jgi:hypothetical protein
MVLSAFVQILIIPSPKVNVFTFCDQPLFTSEPCLGTSLLAVIVEFVIHRVLATLPGFRIYDT